MKKTKIGKVFVVASAAFGLLLCGLSATTISLNQEVPSLLCGDITFGTTQYSSTSLLTAGEYSLCNFKADVTSAKAYSGKQGDAVRLGTTSEGGTLTVSFSSPVVLTKVKVLAYPYTASEKPVASDIAVSTDAAAPSAKSLDTLFGTEAPDISDASRDRGYVFEGLDGGEAVPTSTFEIQSTLRLNLCKIVFTFLEVGQTETSSSSSSSSTSTVDDGIADLSIHVLAPGVMEAGDCIYVRAGENDILIDAGPSYSAKDIVIPRLKELCVDGRFEYVIATHAHLDHIALFSLFEGGIFEEFEVENLIQFAGTNSQSQAYKTYVEKSAAAEHIYTVSECYDSGATGTEGANRIYELGEGLSMQFLYSPDYLKTSEENNYSVSMMFVQGENRYLFMGDTESDVEKKIVASNDIGHCVFYKANHHGSNTSSSPELLAEITPTYVAVPATAGSDQYTQNFANTFPTQNTIDNIAPYTEKIMVTQYALGDGHSDQFAPMNGEIVVSSSGGTEEDVSMHGLTSDTYLPYTDWFSDTAGYGNGNPNRTWPSNGVSLS